MANFYQYNHKKMREVWASYAENGQLQRTNFYPKVGERWMVYVLPKSNLRITTPIVTFDPESGVVVTENSVYVRG